MVWLVMMSDIKQQAMFVCVKTVFLLAPTCGLLNTLQIRTDNNDKWFMTTVSISPCIIIFGWILLDLADGT